MNAAVHLFGALAVVCLGAAAAQREGRAFAVRYFLLGGVSLVAGVWAGSLLGPLSAQFIPFPSSMLTIGEGAWQVLPGAPLLLVLLLLGGSYGAAAATEGLADGEARFASAKRALLFVAAMMPVAVLAELANAAFGLWAWPGEFNDLVRVLHERGLSGLDGKDLVFLPVQALVACLPMWRGLRGGEWRWALWPFAGAILYRLLYPFSTFTFLAAILFGMPLLCLRSLLALERQLSSQEEPS